jgi:hypothetical protein
MNRGELHPETAERLAMTGLTMADFELANRRRQALAHLRAWKARIKLTVKGVVPSINAIKRASKCHWLTVKEAMTFSYLQVLDRVRQAFRRVSGVTNSRKIKQGATLENREQPRLNGGATRKALDYMERCKKLANMAHVPEQIPGSRAVREYRRQRDREEALKIQRENANRVQKKPDGMGIKLFPLEYLALVNKRKERSRWEEEEKHLQQVLQRLKRRNNRSKDIQQFANSAAYRQNTRVSPIGVVLKPDGLLRSTS